mmetsp:Transcript_847/g.995  ORF Transcript_847/g.995 Transcript_847/m.995 type:complete len:173 (-) Transcript_847:229-747(-)
MKDLSQTKLVEAKLRGDLLHTRMERDEVLEEKLILNRTLELSTLDVQNLKQERAHSKNEKLRSERERRQLQALVDTFSASASTHNSNQSSDLEYYKRKSVELETHLQGMTARLLEKNREIHDLRRDRDRNVSQNRLAALKAMSNTTTNSNTTTTTNGSKGNGSSHKKSRYSY